MKIIVTGASGFLGQSLCRYLEAQDHVVVHLNSKNCDLTKPESLPRYNTEKYDAIYHLAAWTQAGDFCVYHPGEQWIINQQINTNTLTWWQRDQPQAKMICMGTSCAYDPTVELKEEKYLSGTPIESLYTYAMSKRMLYVGLKALNKQFGLNYLCAVPSTLYGPGYHTDGRQMHFIFDLIRKIVRGKLYEDQVVLWGDGTQCRELIFVDDFVKILEGLVQTTTNELVNIGAGEEYPIRHFAGLICKYVGFNADKIVYDPQRYVGAKSKCLSVHKLREILPQYQIIGLEDGLGRTIDWFMTKPSLYAS